MILVSGAITIIALLRQREEARRYQHPQNRYGVTVRSRADDTKAMQQHEEYIRRALRLRAEFEPFAQQKKAEILKVLAGNEAPYLLPRDPNTILPHWSQISDSIAAEDLETRMSEAILFSWNATLSAGESHFNPVRNNLPVAESLIGKECIVFWLNGAVTEERRFGSDKTITSPRPVKELAPPYSFLRKTTNPK